MKDSIQSIIRHLLTGLAGIFAFFQSKGLLTSDEASQARDQFDDIVDLIAALAAVVIVKVIIQLLGKVPKLNFLRSPGGGNGATSIIIVMCVLSMALGGGLTSCSMLKSVDVNGTVFYRHPDSGAKAGVDISPGKKPNIWFGVPLVSAETGLIPTESEIEDLKIQNGRVEAAK